MQAAAVNPHREGLYATILVGVLLLVAFLVPALLFPILAAAALVNILRYAVYFRTGANSPSLLWLMGVNALLFTGSAITILFLLPL